MSKKLSLGAKKIVKFFSASCQHSSLFLKLAKCLNIGVAIKFDDFENNWRLIFLN